MWFRFSAEIPSLEWEYFWRFFPLSGSALLFGFFWCGVYRQELSDDWAWRDLWWGWLIGLGISLAILFGLKIPFSRGVFIVSSVTFLALSIVNRAVVRIVRLGLVEEPRHVVLGIGFDEASRGGVKDKLSEYCDLHWFDVGELRASYDNLVQKNPDMLLINRGSTNFDDVRAIFDFGSRFQVPVRMYPSSEDLFLSRTTSESWNGIRLLRSDSHHKIQQLLAIKSVFDFFLTALLFVVVAPVLLLISILIAIVDGFPVFYTQKRVGRGGTLFDMYKFRTMVKEASDQGPELTEGPDDPRITTLGRILRRWSLDELPQLFNILQGDMSLVGPRPEVPSITEDYSPEQRRVLWLKPGLTGLSQVSGREQLKLDRKLEIDQLYLNEYSIGLDLWILLKTFYVVVQGEGSN